jgi:glycosyltransferase involved in cell wall biosynthesis
VSGSAVAASNAVGLPTSLRRSLGVARRASRWRVRQCFARKRPTRESGQSAALSSVTGNIRHFSNPGLQFELASNAEADGRQNRARTIAFFLPQFHTFDENEAWWGKGFSEWRNVSRGAPRYAGHYQPRIPRDLGFYDLTHADTLHAQAALARANGVEAFCFYYYWFDGKRLMEKPLDLFLEAEVEQDFCIMWANENWTRTWDGFDNDVLIEQSYQQADEDAFITDTARYMAHARYVHVAGRPLFVLYRPGLVPDARQTLRRWRSKWEAILGVAPWILMVQGFGDTDPREYSLDGAVEFPPHKLCTNLPDINSQLQILDPEFSGHVRRYEDVVKTALTEELPDYPLIKTVSPHWDNDSRREGRGMTLHGSTPELYEQWLNGAIEHAMEQPFADEPLVFINAWNEWAEGAYLEPDVHFGHAYLNATRRAVKGLVAAGDRSRILLVGHDAHQHGAQMLLLNLAKVYRQQFGMEVFVLLKESGVLLSEYRKLGRTVVLSELGMQNLPGFLAQVNVDAAICNTSVTGDLVPLLRQHGLRVVSLIHEMPNLIEEYGLQEHLRAIARDAGHVIFPSDIVRIGFHRFASTRRARELIMPQGTYKEIRLDSNARHRIRRELGIGEHGKLVMNAGYADLRKGFDLFIQTALRVTQQNPDVHFVWVGSLAPDMERWVQSDLQSSAANGQIHLTGFTDAMADYYSASDCLFLTSREDPYPTVVLEAMNIGMPVVLYRGTTGFDALMQRLGYPITRNDIAGTDNALMHALQQDTELLRQARIQFVEKECQLDDYSFALLQLLYPDLRKVSVVLPNYNYARYLPGRLDSIFNQNYPVFEVQVLDDCSDDDSIDVVRCVAQAANRKISLVQNTTGSGNVFRQWRKGIALCRGEHVWIAEADDLADPGFLSRSVGCFGKDTQLSFCDSLQIDTDGKQLAESYDYYFRQVEPVLFRDSFNLSGVEFARRALGVRNVILNVSAVLWRRSALVGALDTLGKELENYRVAGDWRLYLDVLCQPGARISYIADSLNTHRRHAASVTHSLDLQSHLDEIIAIHQRARLLWQDDAELAMRMDAYIAELRVQFDLPLPASLSEYRKSA